MRADVSITKNSIAKFVEKAVDNVNYPEFAYEQDKDEILKCLHLTEQIFPNHVLMLCLRSHRQFKYISANSQSILGIKNTDIIHWGVSEFIEHIHPADRQAVQQSYNAMSNAKINDPSSIRFAINYRFLNDSGEYIHVLDEKLAVRTTNNTYVFFTIYKNLSFEEKYHHVKMNVYQKSKGVYRNIYTFRPKQEKNIMTPRQNEIAKLITRGFSNQEIADRLSVSLFTIKNHKQHLFKKVNVKNSMELTNFATQHQLIE